MHRTGDIRSMVRTSPLAKLLVPCMLLVVFLGVAGFLCAIHTPYFSALLISCAAAQAADFPTGVFSVIMLAPVLLRGILYYGEQACSHYIALKLFAILQDRVFTVLRRSAPARLEGQDKGNLIYLITSDTEVPEVFHVYTTPPVLIAVVTFGVPLIQPMKMYTPLFMIASSGYLFCGVLLPLIITKLGTQEGYQSREGSGGLDSHVLEPLRGVQGVLQYRIGNQRIEGMQKKSEELHDTAKRLKLYKGTSSIPGNAVVTLFTSLVLLGDCLPYLQETVNFTMMSTSTVLMVSSFGLVLALTSLSNSLLVTMAGVRRMLQPPDEKERVEEIGGRKQTVSGGTKVENLGPSYGKKGVLRNMQVALKEGEVAGIYGKSGSGEPALLKLTTRFWNVSQDNISVHGVDLKGINTPDPRNMQSPITQETILFHDITLNNIQITKLDTSVDGVEEAYRKAGIHEFIMSLPKDYATPITELGDSLSGGECQRIGLARAFLHDCDCILLDELTSNLDALNEAVILKSIQVQKDKTTLPISYRPATMRIADTALSVESGRISWWKL